MTPPAPPPPSLLPPPSGPSRISSGRGSMCCSWASTRGCTRARPGSISRGRGTGSGRRSTAPGSRTGCSTRPSRTSCCTSASASPTWWRARPRRPAELSTDELRDGARILIDKVERWRPRSVAFLGISTYRVGFERRRRPSGVSPPTSPTPRSGCCRTHPASTRPASCPGSSRRIRALRESITRLMRRFYSGAGLAIWMRLPQVSSNTAVIIGPIAAGGCVKWTPARSAARSRRGHRPRRRTCRGCRPRPAPP